MAQPNAPELLHIYEQKVLPVVENGRQSLLVAKPTLKEFARTNKPLPEGVHCTSQPLQGKALPVRRNRRRDEFESVVTRWPDDPLTASRAPILICATEGEADVRIGDYLLHLPEGQMCLLPPETPRTDGTESHTVGAKRTNDRCDVLWIRGSEGAIETWACHSHGHKHWIGTETRRIVIPYRECMLFFSTLVRESEELNREAQTICRGALQILIASLVRELRGGHFEATSTYHPIFSKVPAGWNPIEYARQFINDNLSQHLTIEGVSRLVYMAPTQFTRRFRHETGHTFNQYVTKARLEKAQALLRDTDWTIQFVARNVGINPSHLRRLFDQHTGVSPLSFRRTARRK